MKQDFYFLIQAMILEKLLDSCGYQALRLQFKDVYHG